MRRVVTIVVALALVIGLPLGAAGWSGVVQVPIASSIFGMDHARDLGMQRDRQAFEDFCAKYGITRPSDPDNYTLSSAHQWSGSVEIDGTISEAALGSLREFNSPNPYVDGVNFRIHDGYIEVAAFVKSVPGYPLSGPVYGQVSLERSGPSSLHLSVAQLQFGQVGVPGDIINQAVDELDGYMNDTIAKAGITIDALELREGEIYFKGTWPQTISADPPATGQVP